MTIKSTKHAFKVKIKPVKKLIQSIEYYCFMLNYEKKRLLKEIK